ncbi:hypothetical protein CPB86DRAFT_748946 [Serendipita vermifera]|nr:hypothetical protein CPB86DRAFT_748946 [Serendipita vermifera]
MSPSPLKSNSDLNEPAKVMETRVSDQSTVAKRDFSSLSVLPPLMVISAVSVALGLLPYIRLRRHILHQTQNLNEIRSAIHLGNRQLADFIRAGEATTAAHRLREQQQHAEFQVRLQGLEQKYQSAYANVKAQEDTIRSLEGGLVESNAKAQALERLLEDVGDQMGAALGQAAAFIEEEQRKNGEPDHSKSTHALKKIRELGLLLHRLKAGAFATREENGTPSKQAER